MIRLTSLEIYESIFNIREKNNKFELHKDTFDEISLAELKDELEEILCFSNITTKHKHVQQDMIGPSTIEAYEKLRWKISGADGYHILLIGYARSPFQDFESYLKIFNGLVGGIIQMCLKQYNSYFITYEIPSVIYAIKDFSEAVYTKGDNEGTLQTEYDDITMNTKRSFGLTLATLTFKKLFSTIFQDSFRIGIVNPLM